MDGITLTDRMLIRFGLIRPAAAMPPAKKELSEEEMQKIPRYPPFVEGLPVYAPEKLLLGHRDIIGALERFLGNKELFDKHYMPAMLRLADFVHLLPASQTHHHRGAGGLLRHSLEVAIWGVQNTHGRLIRGVIEPQQRHVMEPRWMLAIFVAGLCHDIGKAITDIAIKDSTSERRWIPQSEGLYEWARKNGIQNYFIHWQDNRGKQHLLYSHDFLHEIIGKASNVWLYEHDTVIGDWLIESLGNNPGANNQVHNYVVAADQESVERDLKSMGPAMAGYEIGVPIERYLTDIMLRLVREGLWRINEPAARIWEIDGKTYLVWPKAGDEIAQRVIDDKIPGLPRTPDGILSMLVERHIAQLPGGTGNLFFVAPDVLTEKLPGLRLKCIRLRHQAIVSSLPFPSVPGRVFDSRESSDAALQANKPELEDEPPEALPIRPESAAHRHVVVTPNDFSLAKSALETSVNTPAIQPAPAVNDNEDMKIARTAVPSPATSTLPAATNPCVLLRDLKGGMGILLKTLVKEFNSGAKSFNELATVKNGQVFLMWTAAFKGSGLEYRHILDGLSDCSWIEPIGASRVGNIQFASGISLAICMRSDISHAILNEVRPASVVNHKPSSTKPESTQAVIKTTRSLPSVSSPDVIPSLEDLAVKTMKTPCVATVMCNWS